MNIDKSNGKVKYNDENHVYWDDNGKYISVTTLIGKYCQPFDKEFWSGYKALEKLLGKDNFKMEKKMLLETKKINLKYYIDMYNITENDYNREQQAVLDNWQKENETACERGTKIHAELEGMFTSKKTTDLKRFGIGGKFEINTNKSLEDSHISLLDVENGVFPEYLIYRQSNDGILKVAGQVDLLVKEGNNIYIIDYKGLPLDTEILTTEGWSTIGKIKVGDKVFDKNGKLTTILHKSKIHNNPCYKIIFDNGDSIIADHEHRWEIAFKLTKCQKRPDGYERVIMTTEELFNYMKDYKRSSSTIPKILNPDPIEMPDKDLPIDPYVLGVWLGDGSKNCGAITQMKGSPVWEEIRQRGYEVGENGQHSPERENVEIRTIYGLRTLLRTLNILQNKNIPDMYYTASFKQRLDLLRGLMDTDGYYHAGRKRFVMSTGQEWQRDCMIKLLGTLGIKCTVFNSLRKCGDKVFQAWDICFSTNNINPFLTRNKEIDFPCKDKNSFRNIKCIEFCNTVPTQCIEVDSPTHTFLCTDKCIVTHNTNKKLDEKSYYNPQLKKYDMMKYPLNNLMDCNMMHYAMQLSTYAWMVQKLNPNFRIAGLKIIHYAHDGSVTEHDLTYYKDEVERMLKDYKKSMILDKRKNARKPIEF